MAKQALLKGVFILDDGIPVPFQYNPEEIEETLSVPYAKKDPIGVSHSVHHYKGGGETKISWTMHISDQLKIGTTTLPFPVELYVKMVQDLCYPIYDGGIKLSDPPEILFVFQAFFKFIKLESVSVTRRWFDDILSLKKADLKIDCFEVVSGTKQRVNSIKNFAKLKAAGNGLSGLTSVGGLFG
jgi:hypothetical protein